MTEAQGQERERQKEDRKKKTESRKEKQERKKHTKKMMKKLTRQPGIKIQYTHPRQKRAFLPFPSLLLPLSVIRLPFPLLSTCHYGCLQATERICAQLPSCMSRPAHGSKNKGAGERDRKTRGQDAQQVDGLRRDTTGASGTQHHDFTQNTQRR